MSVKTSLPRGLVKALDQAEGGLSSFIAEQRIAYDEMSERWQDGDRAAEVSVWLDSLDEVVDALASCQASAC